MSMQDHVARGAERVERRRAPLRAGGLLEAVDGGRMHTSMRSAALTRTADVASDEMRDRLLAFIARRVRTQEDAEDVLQEVMLRIHRHSGELQHADRVGGWIYRIASNAIVDHYRRPSRREVPSGEGSDVPEPEVADAAAVSGHAGTEELRRELAGCLAPLIEQLPAIYREALELTELAGITQTEAAARLGISVSGMKARVQRARAQLKEQLLDCCHVQLDARRRVTDVQSRGVTCGTCGPARVTG
jgi:RNA polymerase sigma-70 factor (ECF subfamily)